MIIFLVVGADNEKRLRNTDLKHLDNNAWYIESLYVLLELCKFIFLRHLFLELE